MFHGNGGNLGHRIPLARIFYVKMRCNVLMLSYRGYELIFGCTFALSLITDNPPYRYGRSEGTPSETGKAFSSLPCTLFLPLICVHGRRHTIELMYQLGLCIDAQTMLNYVSSDPILKGTPIVSHFLVHA